MSTDQTPALARATEANYATHHEHVQALHGGGDHGLRDLPEWVQECWAANTRAAVSAALHDPDGALVRVVKRALIFADNDGDTRGMSQAMSDAYERGARDALDALRAAILGPCPECHGEDGRHKMRCSQTGGGQAHITTTREDS